MKPHVRFRVNPTGPTQATIAVEGELDVAGIRAFIAAVRWALRIGASTIEVDASDATFLDASGLRAIQLGRRVASRADVELYLGATSSAADRLLDLTDMHAELGHRLPGERHRRPTHRHCDRGPARARPRHRRRHP